MMQDIGLRLLIGLILAALIDVVVPDEFFLNLGSSPLLQMLIILIVAVPMYICSTGSIPVAAALIMKGLSPGAALERVTACKPHRLGVLSPVKGAFPLRCIGATCQGPCRMRRHRGCTPRRGGLCCGSLSRGQTP